VNAKLRIAGARVVPRQPVIGYTVTPMDDDPSVLELSNGKVSVLLDTQGNQPARAPSRTEVTFNSYTGRRIRNVINIGIGGSDLGPAMAFEALKHYSDRTMKFRSISNVDATDFVEAVLDLDSAETVFIVSSKTFTTLETMTNAQTARAWQAHHTRWDRG